MDWIPLNTGNDPT